MELRSVKYDKLKLSLIVAGIYEDDMNIGEMRQLAQAVEMSTADNEEYKSIERAIMENDSNFEMTVNSTMIGEPTTRRTPSPPLGGSVFMTNNSYDRDCDSPPTEPIQLCVRAVVHHELNWSPPRADQPLKREAAVTDSAIEAKRMFRQLDEVEGGGGHNPEATPISLISADSGVSCDEIGSLSSISDTSAVPSIGEMPSRLLVSTSSVAISDMSNSHSENSS